MIGKTIDHRTHRIQSANDWGWQEMGSDGALNVITQDGTDLKRLDPGCAARQPESDAGSYFNGE